MSDAPSEQATAPNVQSTLVHVRLRPPSSKESGARCLRAASATDVTYCPTDSGASQSGFAFDHIFGEEVTQALVFDNCCHVVASVLEGYNGTILAYGQTGSGKTHTLIGAIDSHEHQGIVPRAVRALGEGIAADTTPGAEYEVRISVVEIYCERIRDLLDPSGTADNLQVKQDPERGICVEGATQVPVAGEQQLVDVMQTGLSQRAVSATSMNEASSRSHCIVTVSVDKSCPDGSVRRGKLSMVDLAGSERQGKTNATGQTLAEGSQINKSLSALANVIYALTDSNASGSKESSGGKDQASGGATKHVPYRDSKLTRVLQDSLGGTARTVLIVCCSPCGDNAAETLSSLRFGSRARGIKNKVVLNQCLSAEKLQQQLAASRMQVEALTQELAALKQQWASNLGGGSLASNAGLQERSGACGAAAAHAACGIRGDESVPAWQMWAPWLLQCVSVVSLLAYFAVVEDGLLLL